MHAILVLLVAMGCSKTPASPAPPPPPPTPDVTVAVDGAKQSPISPYIYGVNFRGPAAWGSDMPSGVFTLDRFGGNRLSAWNWETNDSNCGNDCGAAFPNDAYLATSPNAPGSAVKSRADADFAGGLAFLATAPVMGCVAADHAGNVPIPVAPDTSTPADPGTRFVPMLARNPGGPHATPDLADSAVYADDFAAWLHATYPDKTMFYSLDNEPDLWGSTHAEARGKTAAGDAVNAGFAELAAKSAATAAAIKAIDARAVIFGPALSGWYGFYTLGRGLTEWNAAKPAGMTWYLDWYLAQMSEASASAGVRLLDVLDVHWYPEATNACSADEAAAGCYADRVTNDWQRTADGKAQWASVIEARVQSPRSLWDPSYIERSWITSAGVPGGGGIALLPRLRADIDARFPGTKIAITEYAFGRPGDISGAVAQADALGIFAREGVFAATLWPTANPYAWAPLGCTDTASCTNMAYGCLWSAFKAFRNYDGAGGRFGDTLLQATSSDDAKISAYASPGVVVVINKAQAPLTVAVTLANLPGYSHATPWQVTGTFGACTAPVAQPAQALSSNTLTLALPALSITTVALR